MQREINKKKFKVLILVVLYNTPLLESKTLNSLLVGFENDFEIELVIWDNSPVPIQNDLIEVARGSLGSFKYISSPENISLSKVYNTIVSDYVFDYVWLLDQDSIIPKKYLENAIICANRFPAMMLFLPLVRNNSKLVSPGSFYSFKGKHWKTERTGQIPSSGVVAITSGMLISSRYFKIHNYKFDERLNLYGIDTKFMLDYASNEKQLYVINETFVHDSALWSDPSADVLLPRFKNMRKAYALMLSDRPISCLLTKIHTIYLSIKYTFKYKDIRFLKK